MYLPFTRPSARPSNTGNSDGDGDRPIRWSEPSREDERCACREGRRDGKRGLYPDAGTNHLPATARYQARFRNASANNEKVLAAQLSPLDEQDQALAAEQKQIEAALMAFTAPEEQARRADEDLKARRARRAANADRAAKIAQNASQQARLDAIKTERARIAEERALLVLSALSHREAARQLWAQLVALYWMHYLRHHPEAHEIRQTYPVPDLTLADDVTVVATRIPGTSLKGL
ncbi:MAG: hypothetical protein QM662_06455 [Gordonia sp. (in: high G+C Gram-positive bacteria)]